MEGPMDFAQNEISRLRALVAELTERLREMTAENARLKEVSIHGCDCSQDDACKFARERDESNRIACEAIDARNKALADLAGEKCKRHEANARVESLTMVARKARAFLVEQGWDDEELAPDDAMEGEQELRDALEKCGEW